MATPRVLGPTRRRRLLAASTHGSRAELSAAGPDLRVGESVGSSRRSLVGLVDAFGYLSGRCRISGLGLVRTLLSMGDGTGQGLVTMVFADVEGSTALLRRVGDEAGLASVRSQLEVVSERVEAYGGSQVKSTGDGFLLTFWSPRQAVAFALASQRALAGSAPRVRFGINTGEVIGADVDPLGAAVNAAARIAGRAAGGEVLVSDVVRQLVGAVPAIRFLDRGRCRLKGFSERWHLWSAEDGTGEQLAPATIGRVAELAAVVELVSSTGAGVGRVLMLEGEAGIGKTHLVREATARARRAGIGVVEVIADELVRRPGIVPHGLLDAVRPGQASRARLDELLNVPPGPAASSEDRSYAVIEASVDLIEEMTRTAPVLVAADDLQWADDLSVGVLAAIVGRVNVSRFSVIGSLRPSPRPAALDRLIERVRAGLGAHVRLDSLDEVNVHALSSTLTGAAPGEELRARLRATAGNPLFVSELLRSLDDDGLLKIESGVADIAPGVTPANLHETLARRLSWLPPETIELLRLASLLGLAFTLRDLAAITGRPVIDVAAWLREASLAGLIVGDGDRLAFRHDLIREAVYGHMLPAERRDLHRAAGQALAIAGAPTQQIAQQFARGALPGDMEAVSWLERAARETLSISPGSAIALLDDAAALAPEDWPGRSALRAHMIEPLAWCGRFADAESIANLILASPPNAAVEYATLRGLSSVYGSRGDTAASIATLQRAAAASGAPDDDARRMRCIAAQLSMTMGTTSVDEAHRVAEATLAHGQADGDATTQCLAHQVLGVAASVGGYGGRARDHFTDAVTLFASGRVTGASYLIPDVFLAAALLELDAIADATVAADEARRRAEQRGTLAVLPMIYATTAGTHLYAGRWDDAIAEAEAAIGVINDTGNLNFVLYCEAIVAKIALHRGDLAAAQAHLTAGVQRLSDGAPPFGADWLFGIQAEFLAASSQPDAALTVAETIWSQTARHPILLRTPSPRRVPHTPRRDGGPPRPCRSRHHRTGRRRPP